MERPRHQPSEVLRKHYGLEPVVFSDFERRIERDPHPELTMIGAEIEVSWASVLPGYEAWFTESYRHFSAEKKQLFNESYAPTLWMLQSQYELAVRSGIPYDSDAFHEFAHRPVHWHATLAKEITTLMDIGLIPDRADSSMHITVGGIEFDVDAGILASTLELVGGSNLKRLTQPASGNLSWARAGIGGAKRRRPDELQNGCQTGVEYRTLVARNVEQVGTVLQAAQLLSSALMAKQQCRNPELAEYWELVKKCMKEEVLKPLDLYKWWSEPVRDAQQWHRFGAFIDSDEADSARTNIAALIQQLESDIIAEY